MNSGVYIHVPFCEQRCHYCAFAVLVSDPGTYEPHIRRILREIELSGFSSGPETIFFGGGTPSLIDSSLLEKILRALPAGATEISVESNPGTLGAAKLEHYREMGINRVSLGAQSFHDEDLKIAGRLHKARHVFSDFEMLRKVGFANVNIDLIAGLPNQRLDTWRQNLDWIDCLRPEHVSIYMLELEEHSAWGKQFQNATPDQNDEKLVNFYREAVDRLQEAGYVHYEISNWALPGFECRHNLKYWSRAPYRGFGISAHSFEGGRRFWNTSSIKEYADQIDSGRLPVSGSEDITRDLQLQEIFLLGLRQMKGFDVCAAATEIGFQYPPEWFDRLHELETAGLVCFDGKVLKLSSAGWLLANGITQELLWPTLLSTSAVTP